jgi:hypothetical protein
LGLSPSSSVAKRAARRAFLFYGVMMQVRIFTIPFNSNLGIFDDGALNDFSKDKEIVGINDYLFTRNEISYLSPWL